MDRWMEALETDPSADDARLLATLAIEDLADFIAAAYDGEFSLVRYAESIATSERSFANIEAGIDRPVMRDFLEPLMERTWDRLDGAPPGNGANGGEGAIGASGIVITSYSIHYTKLYEPCPRSPSGSIKSTMPSTSSRKTLRQRSPREPRSSSSILKAPPKARASTWPRKLPSTSSTRTNSSW